MKTPTIKGIIERRILINYRVDPSAIQALLPAQFRPKLVDGNAIAGICLIRLKNIRPAGFPVAIGIGSENAAHRIAVEWTENGEMKEGVYIPRRDTNLLLNHWAGGSVFPGVHHLSHFEVDEANGIFSINITHQHDTLIIIKATQTDEFNPSSVFGNLDTASAFFKNGAIGFSPNKKELDGLELKTHRWKVSPLAVQ